MIDIINDTNPYPKILGIDWVIDNQTIINFKIIILSFEDYEIRVVAPIDPLKGQRYVNLVNNEDQGNYLDQLYNVMSSKYDYINPTSENKSGSSKMWCMTRRPLVM